MLTMIVQSETLRFAGGAVETDSPVCISVHATGDNQYAIWRGTQEDPKQAWLLLVVGAVQAMSDALDLAEANGFRLFPELILLNDPSRAGQPAGERVRRPGVVITPTHTRFDAVEWFTTDLETCEVVGQHRTCAEALAATEK